MIAEHHGEFRRILKESTPVFIDVQARGEGPPIVFLHGAVSDARVWEPQLDAFSEMGFRAIALGLEGFHPDPFNVARFSATRHVQSICTYIQDYGRQVHLVGHSRGGRLAIAAAAQSPECIASLVAVEAGGAQEKGFLADVTPSRVGPEVVARDMLDQGRDEEALRHYVDFGHGAGAWESTPPLFKAAARANARTLYGTTTDKTQPLSRETAKKITVPTLLVEGTDSPAVFSRINDVLEELIPNVARVRIQSGDHFLTLKLADQFNGVVVEFIRSLEVR